MTNGVHVESIHFTSVAGGDAGRGRVFWGIRFERQRQRREHEAELAREAESGAVSAQGWWRLLAPSTADRYKMGGELLFDDEHREKLIQELAEQETKMDRLMLRFNARMAEERQTEEPSALDGAP